MKSLRNSVTLIGHLGKDPEVKVFGEKKKAVFSLATNDSFKNAKGEKVEDTQWHNIVMWGSLATIAEKYLKRKGLRYAWKANWCTVSMKQKQAKSATSPKLV